MGGQQGPSERDISAVTHLTGGKVPPNTQEEYREQPVQSMSALSSLPFQARWKIPKMPLPSPTRAPGTLPAQLPALPPEGASASGPQPCCRHWGALEIRRCVWTPAKREAQADCFPTVIHFIIYLEKITSTSSLTLLPRTHEERFCFNSK